MDIAGINIPVAIITFILGFMVSRFTLSASDRKKLQQEYYKNSQELRGKSDELSRDYQEAIKAYTKALEEPTYDQFYDIAVKGDRYFSHMNVIADAICSGKVDTGIRDSTFVPGICKAADVSLPRHYEVLQKIAEKKGFEYHGELERSNFRSLYSVVEKFGSSDPLRQEALESAAEAK